MDKPHRTPEHIAQRRSYGTGSLYVREDRNGREQWYGKWHTNGGSTGVSDPSGAPVTATA